MYSLKYKVTTSTCDSEGRLKLYSALQMMQDCSEMWIDSEPGVKQYFAEQICYLFFVALAKNLTSMENIDLLISVQRGTYTLPVAYDYMCRELENMLFYFFGLKERPEELGETESDEKNLLRGLIMSAANVIYLNNYIEFVRKQKN